MKLNLTTRDDFQMHLAPWKTIQNLKGYQGQLTQAEIDRLLKDKPEFTYLISNYRTDDNALELSVALHLRYRSADGTVNTGVLTQQRRAMTFQIPQFRPKQIYSFHIVRPRLNHNDHLQSRCRLTKIYRYPLPLSAPHSLRALARAEICEKYSYDQITEMAEIGEITKDCKEYIQEKASNIKPTRRDILFCEEYRYNKYLTINYKHVHGTTPLSLNEAINAKFINNNQGSTNTN